MMRTRICGAVLAVAALASATVGGVAHAATIDAGSPILLGSNDAGMSPNTGDVTASIIRANEEVAFDYFVARGLSKKQAAGIVGNLDQESGMDPSISQTGGGPGRGIAQWSVGGRWDTYNEVHYTNTTLGVSRYDLTGQLKFTWYELASLSYYGLASLRATTTVKAATQVFQDSFEGCGTCNFDARYAYAKDAYARYA